MQQEGTGHTPDPQETSGKIRKLIRQVPDFPKPGINFYDITTVLQQQEMLSEISRVLETRYRPVRLDAVVAIEARGLIFGAPVAAFLGLPFIPVRKPGKLPAAVEKARYALEYGEDCLEIHRDALSAGMRVIVVDDLLATGGTAHSVVGLCTRMGACVVECAFIIELDFLGGREKLSPTPVYSLTAFDS